MTKKAKIYQPADSVTQSGKAGRAWLLEYRDNSGRFADPTMGWTGTKSAKTQLRLKFPSKEDAVAYAVRNNIEYEALEPKHAKRRIRSYAQNFPWKLVLLILFAVAAIGSPTCATAKTPLIMQAAESGNALLMKRVLSVRPDVDAQNNFGATPLMRAAYHGHTEVGRMLLDAGAKPNLQDAGKQTALHLAAQNNHASFITLMRQYGADMNVSDRRGRTPLMIAAERGNMSAVAALINSGANPSMRDDMGRNAAGIATNKGHKDVAAFLSGKKYTPPPVAAKKAPERKKVVAAPAKGVEKLPPAMAAAKAHKAGHAAPQQNHREERKQADAAAAKKPAQQAAKRNYAAPQQKPQPAPKPKARHIKPADSAIVAQLRPEYIAATDTLHSPVQSVENTPKTQTEKHESYDTQGVEDVMDLSAPPADWWKVE